MIVLIRSFQNKKKTKCGDRFLLNKFLESSSKMSSLYFCVSNFRVLLLRGTSFGFLSCSFCTIWIFILTSIYFRFIFQVMTRYISNPDNLKLMMNMLKEKSRNIQFEAFHVFKVQYFTIVI